MMVAQAPVVAPTQIKGKWLNKGINGHNFYGKCSECKQEFCVDTWYTQNMKYCPNCGTKMEEK
jgi:Zn finger protein HypA/HybF involved in hydrogenase expression